MQEPEIIIVVQGGLVQSVYGKKDVTYRIIDFDKDEDDIGSHDYKVDGIFKDVEAKTREIIEE